MKRGQPTALASRPRDPVLRAVWLVNGAEGLTPGERMAMLVLWRYLGRKRKPIGPALLAGLLHTTTGTARVLLKRLRHKRFIGSDGSRKEKTGKVAVRWLTDRIAWPFPQDKGGNERSRPNGRGVGTGAPADLGVRHTPPLADSRQGAKDEDGACGGDAVAVNIADLICGEKKP